MNVVLANNEKKIAEAMRGLCDAVGKLAEVRDALIKDVETVQPGDDTEQLALRVQRACSLLIAASTVIPEELWAVLLSSNHVGGQELFVRFANEMSFSEALKVKSPNLVVADETEVA